MAAYDRTTILALPAPDDAATGPAAEALRDKVATGGALAELIVVPPGASPTADSLAGLTGASRLTVVAPMDAATGLAAGRDPAALADLLAAGGLTAVRRISLVVDGAGADGADGYAARFHARLRSAHGIETEVTARRGAVAVVTDGTDRGRKRTAAGDDAWASKQPGSKVVLGWADGQQTRTDAY